MSARPDPSSSTEELGYLGVGGCLRALATGELRARELCANALLRIAAVDASGPRVRAVLSLDPRAEETVAALDREPQRGTLHGLPLLVKDTFDTAGLATTAGSLALADCPPPDRDAVCVARLRAAGALVLGKANLSEWSNFRGHPSVSGWSALGGQNRNPHDLTRSPGGSSSGSAAAVAIGLVPAALGSETDGSILCPAAVNGVVGIKPTVGLVPRAGAIPVAPSQDSIGVFARDVAGAAAVLSALAGPDEADPASLAGPGHRDFAADLAAARGADALRGARIGVPRINYFGYSPKTDALVEDVLRALRSAGAEVVDPADVDPGDPSAEWPIDVDRDDEFLVLRHEVRAALDSYLATRNPPAPRRLEDVVAFNEAHAAEEMELFGQEHFRRALETGGLSDPDYLAARERNWKRSRGALERVLAAHRLSALAAPTTGPAWLIDPVNGDAGTGAAYSPSAVAGYPAISVPVGAIDGLPIGLCLFGTAWSESTLLRLAAGVAAVVGPPSRPELRGLGR